MARVVIRASCGGALALLLLLSLPLDAGDEDVAKLLYAKAQKAVRKKSYEEAVDLYKRALKEHTPFPEAAYGLGVALEKLGRTDEALTAFLQCEEDVTAMHCPSKQLRTLAGRARKAVARLGKGFAELQKLDSAFVKGCLDKGRRYLKSHPGWAKRFCETALQIDPDNKQAKGYLERLGGAAGASRALGPFEPFITDETLSDWDPGLKPPWSCAGRVITGDPTKRNGYLNFKKTRLEGTYSYRATLRVVKENADKRTFGLFFANNPGRIGWALLVTRNDDLVLVRYKGDDHTNMKSKVLSSFRATRWHELRVDVEPGAVVCLVDGKEAFRLEGELDDAFDGSPGVFVQQARVEIKDVGARR
ncbi:MAG: tetratricopeptide repeat protein [Planctomycetota bacterium]